MNREIKFRAFDNATKKMYYKSGLTVSDNQIIHMDGQIMQFTGLKDKNGGDIYEGDILNWDYCGSTEWKDWMKDPVYKVIYQDGYFVCAVGITKNLFLHSFRFKYCEVVGNIYQNPELLT